MSESLLEVRRVSRTFRRRSGFGRDQAVVAAVADVSLSVEAGEIVALVGGSGAGKSTVGRMVLGLEEPDEGEVLFDGQELTAMSESERRRARQQMHLVFQDPYQSLHPGMRIGEVVEEPLVIAGAQRQERRARTLAALEHAGITPADRYVDRFPHQLSGGQRQRVAMAHVEDELEYSGTQRGVEH